MTCLIQPPQKIAVLRPLQFGDLMCTIPALRALRAAFPLAQVTLIGLPWSTEFVSRFHKYIDSLLEFPGFPGFPERPPQIEQFPEFIRSAQQEKFDLALQMQGSGSLSNSIIDLLGAKLTAGYYLEGLYRPATGLFFPYPVGEHEIWRMLRLMEYLEIPLQGEDMEFPLLDSDRTNFAQLQSVFPALREKFIVIHAGARASDRRWPPEKFAAVADALGDFGFQIVLTGSEDEKEITRQVAHHMHTSYIDLAGLTGSGTLAMVLAHARLLISNDTGVSHLAAALKIPSVILFSASEPERWAPLDHSLHRAVLWASAAVPQVVIREAEQLLMEERVYAS